MIKLKQPALALHACDLEAPMRRFKMWLSWLMPQGARPADVIYWILYARDHTPEQMLPNVLINTHGGARPPVYNKLYIGGRYTWDEWTAPSLAVASTINIHNVGIFSQLRGKDIGTIWLHGCNAAELPWGHEFCKRMAIESGCNVVAAEGEQSLSRGEAYKFLWDKYSGCIDDYEGRTFCWTPSGGTNQIGNDGAGVPTVG
jgi:hypothetical protein